MEDTSRVVSAALNDLNDRVVDIEDEWVTTEEFSQIEQAVRDTYTKQEIDVMIADIESGGIDNVVTQVNVGATPYNPSNGIVSLPAYPTSLPASDVSSWAKSSTKPTYTATEVGAQEVLVSGTNIKTINNQSLLGSGDITVPIKIYDLQTTDYSSAYYGYIPIPWDTYQSIISDFANGISVAIRTKWLSNDEVAAEYEWRLEQKGDDGQYVFFRFAPNEYCRIFVYPPSQPGEYAYTSAGPIYLSNIERTNNRVTSISSTSTDYTYPTAKAVYNAIQSGRRNLIYTSFNVTGWSDISSGNYSVTTTTFNNFVSYYRDGTVYGIVFRNSSATTSITFRQVFICVGYENNTLYFTNADNGHIYTITWKIVNNAVEKTFTDNSNVSGAKVYAFNYSSWAYDIEDDHLVIPLATYEAMVSDAQNGVPVILRLQSYTTSSGVVTSGDYCDFYLYRHYLNGNSSYLNFWQTYSASGTFHREITLYSNGSTVSISYFDLNHEFKDNKVNSITGSGSTEQYPTTRAVVNYVAANGGLPAVTSSDDGDFLVVKYTNGAYSWNKSDIFREESDSVVLKYNYNLESFSSLGSINIGNGVVGNDGTGDWSWLQYYGGNTAINLQDTLDSKQNLLVSGTNIKTINNQSLLGSGNITISGGSGDTSSCVHITGDESVGGDKTFTDNIAVVDASHILYSGASPSQGFTRGYAIINNGSPSQSVVVGGLLGEPKAFILTYSGDNMPLSDPMVIGIVKDSVGCHGVYTTGTQHNYSSAFTTSYSNGTLTITAPAGVEFVDYSYNIVYYYGEGTLTFKISQVQPGSGATTATFTGASLTELPAFYAILLESQVNNESYRRVAYYTNESGGSSATPKGVSFFSSQIHDTTSSFSVSYNNGLVINSGGTNAGGYFHNPGTYTLYYLMASDIGSGGSGSYNSLKDELDGIRNTISGIETLLAAI